MPISSEDVAGSIARDSAAEAKKLKERVRRLERAVELLTLGLMDDAYSALHGDD